MRALLVVVLLASGCAGDRVEAGAEVYEATCETCHGADGGAGVQLDGRPAADLAEVVPTLDDDALVTVIEDGYGAMPAQDLSAREARDCVAWLRATFGG